MSSVLWCLGCFFLSSIPFSSIHSVSPLWTNPVLVYTCVYIIRRDARCHLCGPAATHCVSIFLSSIKLHTKYSIYLCSIYCPYIAYTRVYMNVLCACICGHCKREREGVLSSFLVLCRYCRRRHRHCRCRRRCRHHRPSGGVLYFSFARKGSF